MWRRLGRFLSVLRQQISTEVHHLKLNTSPSTLPPENKKSLLVQTERKVLMSLIGLVSDCIHHADGEHCEQMVTPL